MGILADPLSMFLYFALGSAGLLALGVFVDMLIPGRDRRAEELRARLGEVLAEKEALEKKLLEAEEQLAEARGRCEREKAELVRSMQEKIEALRRDYEARLREAMDENKAALALYEAVKTGIVKLGVEGCKEVLIQLDGQVLCRVSETELRILWPKEPEESKSGG